jgi:ribosomal protein S18 acetylase RimI-like enzyme
MNITIVEKSLKDIELMKPLWEQLNKVHGEKSVYFKKRFKKLTFGARMESIYDKAQNGTIKLDMLFDHELDKYVGYCLCSIEGSLGEIESIYIENEYRKYGFGGKLMENILKWFEQNGINNIQISVVYNNYEALPFYEHYGFHISSYILKRNKI